MVLITEVGGRFSEECIDLVRKCVDLKAQHLSDSDNRLFKLIYHRRWWGILSVSLQKAVAHGTANDLFVMLHQQLLVENGGATVALSSKHRTRTHKKRVSIMTQPKKLNRPFVPQTRVRGSSGRSGGTAHATLPLSKSPALQVGC